jgi:hypothetical protein
MHAYIIHFIAGVRRTIPTVIAARRRARQAHAPLASLRAVAPQSIIADVGVVRRVDASVIHPSIVRAGVIVVAVGIAEEIRTGAVPSA